MVFKLFKEKKYLLKMELKKILIFYPSFERGGVELILTNIIRFFIKKKIKVILISNIPEKIIIKDKLFKKINPNYKKKFILPDRLSKAFKASIKLYKVLKQENNKDTIVFSLQSSSVAILISKILNFKIVARNAEDPLYSALYSENKLQSLFIILFKIITYNFANGIITNSIGSKKSMRRLLFFNDKVENIYNPYLKKNLQKKKKSRSKIILSAGRLTKQKDFVTLINAFNLITKQIPNYKMIIIGDGPQRKKLQRLIEKFGLTKKIEIKGWLKNLDKYYSDSKIFVLSSIYEGLGNVLIDAANHNLPIITSNCKSGPPEIVDFGKGGYLFPVSNSLKLSKTLLYALKNYKISIKKSNYAKKRIDRFFITTNSSLYLSYIKKVFYE